MCPAFPPSQVLIPTVLIVYIGLLSALLSADDYSGDRAALLGVSILICMVNLERDHGLGNLMYSTWFDMFNLVQLGVQFVALVEGFVEHKLIKKDKEAAALMVNYVWCWAMMVFGYPLITIGVMFLGIGYLVAGYVLLGLGVPLIILFSIFAFRRGLNEGERQRSKIIEKLRTVERGSRDFNKVLMEAFEVYDLDGSGALDMAELRTLLKAVFVKDKVGFQTAMHLSREMAAATKDGQARHAALDSKAWDTRTRTQQSFHRLPAVVCILAPATLRFAG
jgi:hypothetical protein